MARRVVDLASGRWHRRRADLLELHCLDLDSLDVGWRLAAGGCGPARLSAGAGSWQHRVVRVADFPFPSTTAAAGALDLARQYQPPSITAHAMRSWLWAEAFAVVDGIDDVDHELLFVAAVLHDIGTVTEYDNHTLSYEHAGGHVGVALTAGAGWPTQRRQRVLEVVVRHNWVTVDPALDVEGHLLETATSLDISGLRPDDLPVEFLREVLTAYPRGDLADVFTACVADQADRKPTTAARRLLDGGLAEKLRRNPLERPAERDGDPS